MTDWRDQAACKAYDPSLWFPERGETKKAETAKSICAGCPVRAECLDYAARNAMDTGIWGGESSRGIRAERRRLGLLGKRNLRPIDHGTHNGWQAHRRRGEKPCPACLRGRHLYEQLRKEKAGVG